MVLALLLIVRDDLVSMCYQSDCRKVHPDVRDGYRGSGRTSGDDPRAP
jgi:hypothetical protein